MRVPRVAWPTLLLCAAALAGWIGAGALALAGAPWPAVLAVGTVAAFVAFTPMHDASHRAVSRGAWVNGLVGRLAGLPLMAPFAPFRLMHLAHHRHTNQPDLDPDHWSGTGPAWQLPLRWLSQDLHYYARYLGMVRPPAERVEALGTAALMWALVVVAVGLGFGTEVLLAWVLPARLATGMLACAFDWLPHRPHATAARDDRFAATVNLSQRWLHLPLLGQDLHLVHHLYPAVPFYRYAAVWRLKRPALEARGARTVSVWARRGSGAA